MSEFEFVAVHKSETGIQIINAWCTGLTFTGLFGEKDNKKK